MKKSVLILAIFSFYSSFGQGGAGSVYSLFGIGELKPWNSAQNTGMGFTSIGMSNPYYVNTVNPAANAALSGCFSHIFDMGIFMNSTNLKTTSESENVSDGGLAQLSYWFRFNNKWSGLIGLSNYSNVGYNIVDNNVLVSNNNEFSVSYEGSGGLSNIYFSNSLQLTKNLSIGARASFIFGNIFNNEIAESVQGGDEFNVENSIHIRQLNVDFGANYLIQNEKHRFNIGLIYDNGTNMVGNVSSNITSRDLITLYDERESTTDYSLPEKLGLGISFQNENVLIGADVEFNRWSLASVGDDNILSDTWRTSIGLEYTPDRQGDMFLQRVNYRAGAYLENSYLEIDNTTFNKWGITAGLGIPVRNTSSINLSYHRKYNGTLINGLVYESTNEFTLNVSIKERWFVKNKYF